MSAERLSLEPHSPQNASWALPESFRKAVEDMKPDGLDWSRIEAAMDVLRGEKEAVTPKPPEPEPTEEQKYQRDMYRSGKLTPYQKDRPWLGLQAAKDAWNSPELQGETSRLMAADMALRGGADKEYNQLGDWSHRKERIGAMVKNMGPNILFDIVSSLPYNFGRKLLDKIIDVNLEKAKALPESDNNKKALIKKYELQHNAVKAVDRLGEVYNDKDITARGDRLMREKTGEQGWFTGEASDKLNDLLTSAFKEYIEDFVNGPTIESAFRIIYQVPIIGALVEQGWTRWTNFQSKDQFHKGRLKAVYVSIGMFIGLMRKVDEKKQRWTPSALIVDGVWNGLSWLNKRIRGVPPSVPSMASPEA